MKTRRKYVEVVLGWVWMSNHLGTAHWQGPDGRCHMLLPEFVMKTRVDQLRRLIEYEIKRRKELRSPR